jgi:hypothetical protein
VTPPRMLFTERMAYARMPAWWRPVHRVMRWLYWQVFDRHWARLLWRTYRRTWPWPP